MTKRKHHHKAKHKAKPSPKTRHRACDSCGETDGKLRSVVVQVDGRSRFNERLCRVCTGVVIMRVCDHTPGFPRS